MADLNPAQTYVLWKAVDLYKATVERANPFWIATLLAKTKAEQKAILLPFLNAVKDSNTLRFGQVDSSATTEKANLTAENTTIDNIIAAI